MPFYNPRKHHRRSIRLKGYDYAQAGLYFITVCVQNREHIFGEIKNGELILNEFGQIADEEWANTPNIRPNITLGEFIIMPNHIHGIIEINNPTHQNQTQSETPQSEIGLFKSPSQTIGAIIRGYKIATIKKIKDTILSTGELQFAPTQFAPTQFAPTEIISTIKSLDFKIWQRNYYEHIIRDEQSYQRISQYIINNPAKWQGDKFYTR